jgi:hypothetical protein
LTVQLKQRKRPCRWLAHLALAAPLLALAASPAAVAQDCDVRGTVERPTEDAVVTNQPVVISGWAADITAESGSGISEVRIALDADPDQGGVAVPALYGWQRPDVAELLSAPRFAASGLALSWDATGVAPGRHTLYIQARSACGWITVTRTVLVAGQQSTTTAPASPTPVRSTAPGATTPSGTAAGTGPTAPGAVPGATSPGVTVPSTGATAPGAIPGTGQTLPGAPQAVPGAGQTVPGAPQTVPGTAPGTGPTAPGGVTAPAAPGGLPPGQTAPGVVPGAVRTPTPTPGIPLVPRTR